MFAFCQVTPHDKAVYLPGSLADTAGLNDTEQKTSKDVNTVGKEVFRKAILLENTF